MNFLSFGLSCDFHFLSFLVGISILAFNVVCILIILELGYKVYKEKKILFSLIVFLILGVIIVVVKMLPDLFIEQYVNGEIDMVFEAWNEQPSPLDKFSRLYIKIWLCSVPVISYIYFRICRYICKVKKLSKKVLYALYRILLVVLAVLPLVFLKSYDYFVEKNNSFNDCWWYR